MTLAEYLTEIMHERRIDSQRDLAVAAGVSQATINNILKGRMVKADTLKIIAENLKLPVDDILRAAGYLPPKGGQAEIDALTHLILAGVSDLPSEDKREILALINAKLARRADAEDEA